MSTKKKGFRGLVAFSSIQTWEKTLFLESLKLIVLISSAIARFWMPISLGKHYF